MKRVSRAVRNCNPGNIRHATTKYLGEVESTDKQFKQFSAMEWGFRAIFVLLHTYVKRYRLTTIPEMIARYAPPSENKTDKYADFVCRSSRLRPTDTIDTLCAEQMCAIVFAIAQMESGRPPTEEDVEAGWRLFLKHKP